jgi:hypothetical protein
MRNTFEPRNRIAAQQGIHYLLGSVAMRYTVHSNMMAGLTSLWPQLARHVFLCRIWRGMSSWLLAPIGYFGLLLAPSVIFSIPFEVFQRHHVSLLVYWFTITVIGALVLWLLYRLGCRIRHSFRQRVIELETVIGFIAFTFVPIIIVWIYAPR